MHLVSLHLKGSHVVDGKCHVLEPKVHRHIHALLIWQRLNLVMPVGWQIQHVTRMKDYSEGSGPLVFRKPQGIRLIHIHTAPEDEAPPLYRGGVSRKLGRILVHQLSLGPPYVIE